MDWRFRRDLPGRINSMRKNEDCIKNSGKRIIFREYTEDQKSVKTSQKRDHSGKWKTTNCGALDPEGRSVVSNASPSYWTTLHSTYFCNPNPTHSSRFRSNTSLP